MNYEPLPIDVSAAELPAELAELSEKLARNNHEIWARQRIADGWRYGPARDDALKEHPCLVPYDQLPEHERTYDRVIATGMLRTLLALGFRIEKPD